MAGWSVAWLGKWLIGEVLLIDKAEWAVRDGGLAGELMARRRDVRLSWLTHGWMAGWRVGHRGRDLDKNRAS